MEREVAGMRHVGKATENGIGTLKSEGERCVRKGQDGGIGRDAFSGVENRERFLYRDRKVSQYRGPDLKKGQRELTLQSMTF